MSYLSEPTSVTDYGVVKVGDHIDVSNGIISLPQDLGQNAAVEFSSVSAGIVYSELKEVVTFVNIGAGAGIGLDSVVNTGPSVSFTIQNAGVLSLTAGPGITITQSTGDIYISAVGADLISVYGTSVDYTVTPGDEYIGVSSASTVQIILPPGVDGRVYTIKNERGSNFGNIVVQPDGSEQIDGKGNYVIKSPYQSINIVSRAGDWWII